MFIFWNREHELKIMPGCSEAGIFQILLIRKYHLHTISYLNRCSGNINFPKYHFLHSRYLAFQKTMCPYTAFTGCADNNS